MIILGLESSCDDTAAAVVRADGTILSSVVAGQMDEHARFGGVVPEIAARAHLESMDHVIGQALAEAGVTATELDGVAATAGPGLIGGVMVGLVAGKTLAATFRKPFVGVNHLEGHTLTARLSHKVAYPYLLLLVSGGHSQIVWVAGLGDYQVLGTTRDDAAGECLDKSAKLMGLPFPGGAALDALAMAATTPNAYKLPIPLKGQAGCDFSFAGLKTAMRDLIQSLARSDGTLAKDDAANASAALMTSVSGHLCDRLEHAFAALPDAPSALVVSGGVAASQFVRVRLTELAAKQNVAFIAPPGRLCTDNAAMIAWAGIERLQAGLTSDLGLMPRPRWPLMELSGTRQQ